MGGSSDACFEKLKQAMTSVSVLTLPNLPTIYRRHMHRGMG